MNYFRSTETIPHAQEYSKTNDRRINYTGGTDLIIIQIMFLAKSAIAKET